MSPRRRPSREDALSALPSGTQGTIAGISVDRRVRRELSSMGLLEGTAVRVVRRAPLGGAVLVAVGRSQYALGPEVAREIRVRVG